LEPLIARVFSEGIQAQDGRVSWHGAALITPTIEYVDSGLANRLLPACLLFSFFFFLTCKPPADQQIDRLLNPSLRPERALCGRTTGGLVDTEFGVCIIRPVMDSACVMVPIFQ